jgi:hypothetical protein
MTFSSKKHLLHSLCNSFICYGMAWSCSTFLKDPRSSTGIKELIVDILTVVDIFWACVIYQLQSTNNNGVTTVLIGIIETIQYVSGVLKYTAGTHSI